MSTPKLDSTREIEPEDIDNAIEYPSSFYYSGDLEIYDAPYNPNETDRWVLGAVFRTRDSSLLESSNADALIKHLESDPSLEDDWTVTGSNHFLVGWVDHLSFKLLDAPGEPSRIFRLIMEWFDALSDYPVADEEDYSERQWDAFVENVAWACSDHVRSSAPDDYAEVVADWMACNGIAEDSYHNPEQCSVSDEEAIEALAALNWWDIIYTAGLEGYLYNGDNEGEAFVLLEDLSPADDDTAHVAIGDDWLEVPLACIARIDGKPVDFSTPTPSTQERLPFAS